MVGRSAAGRSGSGDLAVDRGAALENWGPQRCGRRRGPRVRRSECLRRSGSL